MTLAPLSESVQWPPSGDCSISDKGMPGAFLTRLCCNKFNTLSCIGRGTDFAT